MTQLNELRVLNDSTILYLKKTNQNYEKNSIIKNILDDDACFFKMGKDDAHTVLKEVGIRAEEIEEMYKKLIARSEFYKLLQCNKINIEDKELVIKYPVYDSSETLKKLRKEDERREKELIIPSETTFVQKIINMFKNLFKK